MTKNKNTLMKLLRVSHNQTSADIAVLIIRVAVSALMLSHGVPKLLSLLSGNVEFPSVLGLGSELSLLMAVFAEVICTLFVLVGLGTRIATIPLMITMLVAVLHIHATDPFVTRELGLLYLISYLVLFIMGSGRYSVDYKMQQAR